MDYRALVYSRDNCPWCEKALALLEQRGYPVRVLKFPNDFTREELQAIVGPNKRPTVPQVYLDEKYIGGYEQLRDYIEGLDAGH